MGHCQDLDRGPCCQKGLQEDTNKKTQAVIVFENVFETATWALWSKMKSSSWSPLFEDKSHKKRPCFLIGLKCCANEEHPVQIFNSL